VHFYHPIAARDVRKTHCTNLHNADSVALVQRRRAWRGS
jgi:hypothetical protein